MQKETLHFSAGDDAAPDFETTIRLRCLATRSGIPDGVPATLLHICAEYTAVASGNGIEPAATLRLAIGSRKTAIDHFKHKPPTAPN